MHSGELKPIWDWYFYDIGIWKIRIPSNIENVREIKQRIEHPTPGDIIVVPSMSVDYQQVTIRIEKYGTTIGWGKPE